MRKLRRVLVRSIAIAAALILAVAVLVVFLITTRPGAQIVIGYLEGKLPVQLAVEAVDGRLVGPLELGNVRLMVSGVSLEVDHLEIDWRPQALLRGRRVHLKTVRIDGMRIAVLGKDQKDVTADSTVVAEVEVAREDSVSLPIELAFDDLQLSNGSISVPEVLEVRQVELHARGSVESYAVELRAVAEALDLPAAQVSASGSGSLTSLSLDSLESALLRGELRARGSISWIPQVRWQLAIEADSLAPGDLAPNLEDWPGRLSLAATTSGRLEAGQASVTIDVDTLQGSLRGQPVAGSLSGTYDGSEYRLARVDLDWGQIRIDAAGTVSRERLTVDFDLEAPDLGAALPRASGSVSAAGKLAGSPSSPQIDASLRAHEVSVGTLRLDSARAVLDLDWASQRRNEAIVKLSGIEIANQVVDSANIELRGTREDHQLTVRIDSDRGNVALLADGGLRGSTWEGVVGEFSISTEEVGTWRIDDSFGLAIDGSAVEMSEMCLAAEESSLCLGGSWASQRGWQIASSLERMPLTLLDPILPEGWSLSGRISGEVSGDGDGRHARDADVELSSESGTLEYAVGERVDTFRFNSVGLAIRSHADSLSSDLTFEFADTGDVRLAAVSAHALLPPIELLTQRAASDSLAVAMHDQWQISVSMGDVLLSAFDRFLPESTRTTAFRISEGNLSVRSHADSLSGDFAFELVDTSDARPSKISGQLLLPPIRELSREAASQGLVDALLDDWRLSASIDSLPLALFDRLLPESMQLTGSLDGSLSGQTAANGDLRARLEIIPKDAAFVRTLEDEVRTLRIVEPSVQVRIDSAGLLGEASLAAARPDSAPHLSLSASVRLPEYNNVAQSVRSQILEAELSGAIDLSLVDALAAAFSATVGQMSVDLAARGTVAELTISGQYRIRAQTDIPSLGIQLRDIDITAAAGPEGNLDIKGGFTSGDGRLEIAGAAPIIPSREHPGRLTISGNRFLATQTDQITLFVSPNLEVLWTGTTLDVSGDVTVPRATIEIIEIPESAVRPSEDVVLVGAESQPRRPMDVSANVRLILGEEILFKGFGFTTNVEGTLQLVEQPGAPTQGRGELVLREGVYRGYGQNLTIDPGRLIFAGPIDDPTLNVRAYRRATDGTRAGFLISGTLKSPDLQVWSDPVMSESAVLSYVLFGRSTEQGSSAEQAQAGNAAAILGGNILAMSMATRVGLDDARIEAGARQQDAAFYAGKYLSPRLYVAYGTGLFEPIEVIRVRYLISGKLTLQTETGSRDSADLLYRIER